MRKCFISKNYRHTKSAGDKAKTDIEAILLKKGFVNIGLKQNRCSNAIVAYIYTLCSVLFGLMRLRKGDILIVQYPLKKYYDFVVKSAVRRGAKVVTIIHDLGSFRRKKLTVGQEISRLNRSSVIIVHSRAMSEWLIANGLTAKTVVLGIFDYLSDSKPNPSAKLEISRPKLMFAGDCSPRNNGWIYELTKIDPNIDLIVYGGGVDDSLASDNIHAKGYVGSDDIIASADGDFGVAWYGNSLDDGAGPLGEYLRYNAPHKTSLYLRAGIPVIVWDKAAQADIIKQLDAGICVSSLRDVGAALASITPQRYAELRQNAALVAMRLAGGDFISIALDQALNSK